MKKIDEQTTVNKAMLEQQIAELKNEINDSEKNLIRSLAALMDAIVNETSFNRSDVEFFKTLMAMIKLNRERLQILSDTLNSIE